MYLYSIEMIKNTLGYTSLLWFKTFVNFYFSNYKCKFFFVKITFVQSQLRMLKIIFLIKNISFEIYLCYICMIYGTYNQYLFLNFEMSKKSSGIKRICRFFINHLILFSDHTDVQQMSVKFKSLQNVFAT